MQHILNSNKSLLNYTQWIARKQGIHFEYNVFNYKKLKCPIKTSFSPLPFSKKERRRKFCAAVDFIFKISIYPSGTVTVLNEQISATASSLNSAAGMVA
jgi:hypothetical protein